MRLDDLPDTLLACALVLGIALVASPSASADDSFSEKIEGSYQSSTSTSVARDRIDKRIESVVEKMPFYKRPFARNKLQEGTSPCQNVTFSYDDGEISIRCDSRPPAVAPSDGTTTEYTDESGETHRLSQTVREDRVIQVFNSENGSRTNTYRLSGDDTLVMTAKLESPQLPEPITYARTFERN